MVFLRKDPIWGVGGDVCGGLLWGDDMPVQGASMAVKKK
jgi:hypothetical protein